MHFNMYKYGERIYKIQNYTRKCITLPVQGWDLRDSLEAFTEGFKVHPAFLGLGSFLVDDMFLLGLWQLLSTLLTLWGYCLGVRGWGRGKSSPIWGGRGWSSGRGRGCNLENHTEGSHPLQGNNISSFQQWRV